MNTFPRRCVFALLSLVAALLAACITTYYDIEEDDTWSGLFGKDGLDA